MCSNFYHRHFGTASSDALIWAHDMVQILEIDMWQIDRSDMLERQHLVALTYLMKCASGSR